jgi:hypothetical protein
MADNTTLPGTGEVYASEDRGGVNYQRVLINTFDGPGMDAFGRWRVSEPTTLFDSKLLGSDDAPLFWDESLESGAGITATTPTEAKPYIDLVSTNTTAGKFTRQTFRRFNYQPGKSQLILMTGVLELASGTKTGCERRIGYFDDNNGAFFESDAGTIGVTTRTNDSGSPSDTTVAQANWNLDNLDGDNDAANPSGVTADWTKAQIFVIDFQWLSVGRVRFGIEINGIVIYVHQHNVSNVTAIPWASTPNLPLRYQIITTSSSGVCSMRVICSSVLSEGGTEETGIVRHRGMLGTHTTAETENTLYALLGFRLKSTHLGVTIRFLEAAIQIQDANNKGEWIIVFNPTVAGTFTYGDITNSALQVAQGVTANTVTGGTHNGGGYVESGQKGGSATGELKTSEVLGAKIDGTRDEIVLCFRPIGGSSSVDVEGMMIWREES